MSRVGTLTIKTNPKRGALGVGESVASLTRLLRWSGPGFGGWGGRPVWPSDATQTKAASAKLKLILGLSVPTVGIELIHRLFPPLGGPVASLFNGPGRRGGERSSPDRATSGQRVVNCLVRIASNGLARVDKIISVRSSGPGAAVRASWVRRRR